MRAGATPAHAAMSSDETCSSHALLAEHSELRHALRLRAVPDHKTLNRFLRRLDEAAITHALEE